MSLDISRLCVEYGSVSALVDVNLTVSEGEVLAVLGPSGSGKTTLLQILAGINQPTRGEVRLEGSVLARPGFGVPSERRGIGMVFQDLALWPHMTVQDTIRFPLESLKMPRNAQLDRVAELIRLVRLDDLGARYPHELSGGQRQRVAIARALANRPALILLDEPMSSLDARLRETMRVDLARILKEERATAVYVTHDRLEAMAIADRVLLLRQGRVIQVGKPSELYGQPADRLTAEFMGPSNWFEAEVVATDKLARTATVQVPDGTRLSAAMKSGAEVGTRGLVLIRPEQIALASRVTSSPSWRGRVIQSVYLGAHWQVEVELHDGPTVTAFHVSEIAVGAEMGIRLVPDVLWFIPEHQR